jgi:PmbA protein
MNQTMKIGEIALAEARRCGADDADVILNNYTSSRVKVRLGKTEELRQSNPRTLGIRVFLGQRKALTYTSDLRPEAVTKMVRKALEIARVSGVDEFQRTSGQDPVWNRRRQT